MPIKFRPNEELETIANEFLAQKAKGHYDGLSLRIEPLIEEIGYTIFPVKGLSEIAEAYLPLKEGFIIVDEDQCLSYESLRYRFTLAEELAHVLLHRPMFAGMNADQAAALQESFTDKDYTGIEREAKYLAGALLMPRANFIERFEHYSSILSQSEMNNLRLLRRITRKLFFDFNVSYAAVCVRAANLKLIEWDELPDLLPSSSK